jgi:hypothetical protein
MTELFDIPEVMLTTVDNPFDPFTDFDAWNSYDIRLGYNTCAFLDRVSQVSDDLSESEQALALYQAIEEIVHENVSGMWVKVTRDGR